MRILRLTLAAITALTLITLAVWAIASDAMQPQPITTSVGATTVRSDAAGSGGTAPRQVPGWFLPGGLTVQVTITSGPLARCPAWPQLVRVTDASGMRLWVTQQDAGPAAPELLAPDGLLPVDPSPLCGEAQP